MSGLGRDIKGCGLALCLGFVALLGCSDRQRDANGKLRLAVAPEPDVVVRVATLHQHITGFGASTAWHSGGLSDERADLFFSPDAGLGLSLLRIRIAPDGTTVETQSALQAHERGARVWAAPWSPPAEWKSNADVENGGRLLPEYYDDWAELLATFAQKKASEGIPLLALSAQNEPDWVATWETCEWTPEELTTFIRDHLGPALEAKAPGTKLLAPESANWNSLASYADSILGDEVARDAVDVIAVHDYGGTPYAYAAPAENEKEFWETEISYHDFEGVDLSIQTANAVHEHLTIPQVNAFHYWWLINDNPDAALFSAGQLNPPAYGLGHFSKFIRPGYHRVSALPALPAAGVAVSAYFGRESGKLVIVAVNANATPVEQTIDLTGSGVASLAPWVTNGTDWLEPASPFAVGDSFTYELDATSITTFVGDGTPVDPGGSGAGGESGAEGGAPSAGGANADGAAGEAPSAGGESGGGTVPGSGGTTGGTGGDSANGGAGLEPTAGAPDGSGGTGGSSAGRGGRGGSRNSGDDADDDRPRPGNACACRAAGVSDANHGAWLGVVALGLVLSARRRKPRSDV